MEEEYPLNFEVENQKNIFDTFLFWHYKILQIFGHCTLHYRVCLIQLSLLSDLWWDLWPLECTSGTVETNTKQWRIVVNSPHSLHHTWSASNNDNLTTPDNDFDPLKTEHRSNNLRQEEIISIDTRKSFHQYFADNSSPSKDLQEPHNGQMVRNNDKIQPSFIRLIEFLFKLSSCCTMFHVVHFLTEIWNNVKRKYW